MCFYDIQDCEVGTVEGGSRKCVLNKASFKVLNYKLEMEVETLATQRPEDTPSSQRDKPEKPQ